MIQLALIRHGRTHWNQAGKIQGRTDIPLEAESVTELAKLALPDEWQHASVVSSPLQRAVKTAELITGQSPIIEPALIEMDYGDWEGRRGIDLYAEPESGFRHLPDWGWDYQPPNGETPAQLRSRLLPWVRALSQDTVAVCHIGVMRVLLALAHDWNFKGTPPFNVKRNSLYCLHVTEVLSAADPLRVRLVQKVE